MRSGLPLGVVLGRNKWVNRGREGGGARYRRVLGPNEARTGTTTGSMKRQVTGGARGWVKSKEEGSLRT